MNPSLTSNPNFQRLLSVTEQTIQELGCNKTTLQEIITRSGLSKGAIYHYVKSKDELFSLVLETKSYKINEKFNEAVQRAVHQTDGLSGPLEVITEGIIPQITDDKDVSNMIFVYLLSRREDPAIQTILRRMNEHSLAMTTKWIEIGQQHDVISKELDAEKTASTFLLYVYGLRVQRMIEPQRLPITETELFNFFYRTLFAGAT
ncbi:TetR/AcrR family transcriptional regulator [Aneurinibacillus sp. BA2021]|nr:TetR/AcrR family transcriptional regulator [Aneurinibacillus sp. BA2021]